MTVFLSCLCQFQMLTFALYLSLKWIVNLVVVIHEHVYMYIQLGHWVEYFMSFQSYHTIFI